MTTVERSTTRRVPIRGCRPRGLTLLLEALLGLTLVTIVLLVILQLFPVSDRSVGLADRTTQANYIARSLMEKQLATAYIDLSVGSTDGETVVADHTRRRGSSLSTTFTWQVEISQPDPDIEVKEILVSVAWREGASNQERLSSVKLQSARGNLW